MLFIKMYCDENRNKYHGWLPGGYYHMNSRIEWYGNS